MSECGLPSPHITSITVDFDVGQRVHPDTHPVGHCLEVETVLTGHSCLNRVALFYVYVMLRICYLIYALCTCYIFKIYLYRTFIFLRRINNFLTAM